MPLSGDGRIQQIAGGTGREHHQRRPGPAEVGLQGGHPQREARGNRHRQGLVRLSGEAQQTGQRQPLLHRAHLRDLPPAGLADPGGRVPHASAEDLGGGRGGHQTDPHPQCQKVQRHHSAALGGRNHQTGPPTQKGLNPVCVCVCVCVCARARGGAQLQGSLPLPLHCPGSDILRLPLHSPLLTSFSAFSQLDGQRETGVHTHVSHPGHWLIHVLGGHKACLRVGGTHPTAAAVPPPTVLGKRR